jgi:hypothetical protein
MCSFFYSVRKDKEHIVKKEHFVKKTKKNFSVTISVSSKNKFFFLETNILKQFLLFSVKKPFLTAINQIRSKTLSVQPIKLVPFTKTLFL